MKNSNDTIGNQTRYLPACSVVPHLLRHRAPYIYLRSIPPPRHRHRLLLRLQALRTSIF